MDILETPKKLFGKLFGRKSPKDANLRVELNPVNPIAPAQYEFLIERKIPTVEITIHNPYSKDITDVQVEVRLQGISDWISKPSIVLKKSKPNQINLIIPASSEKLYHYEEKNISLDFRCNYIDARNKAHKITDSTLIKVLAKDDMIWAMERDGELIDLSLFIAAWVTPRDPEVEKIIHTAAFNPEATSIGGILGYQITKNNKTLTEKITVKPNQHYNYGIHLRKNALLSGVLKTVIGGTNNDVDFYVMNSYNAIIFGKQRTKCYEIGKRVTSGYHFNFVAPEENDYYLIFDNSFSSFSSKTITILLKIETPLSKKEIVMKQIKSLYETIKQNGMNYVDTHISFAPGNSQRVKRPSDTIKLRGGNCIDGSVLFASCFEAIGFEPLIFLIPGHAFVGVREWKGSDNYIFVETTNIRNSDFHNALNSANTVFRQYQDDIKIIDIKKARELQIKPLI
jgi:hypothetical protein